MIDPRTYYKMNGFTEAAKAADQIAKETGGMFYLAYRIEEAAKELRRLELQSTRAGTGGPRCQVLRSRSRRWNTKRGTLHFVATSTAHN